MLFENREMPRNDNIKLLGIDTATDMLNVALVEGKQLIAESRSAGKRAHGERLMPTIEGLLQELHWGLKDLSGIAICIGPGSFTGLRIGLAAVKGLAFATGLPVVSVVTLDVLAIQAKWWQFEIRPLIKAQGDEAYTATYKFEQQQLIRKSAYELINLSALKTQLKKKTLLLTSGINNIESFIPEALKKRVEIVPPEEVKTSGWSVALLGLEKFSNQRFENVETLEPFYLKDFKAKRKVGI